MPLDSVDLETAKAARGARLVVNAMVPSPWSEAAKGCFRVAGVSALVVHRGFDSAAIDAWTGVDNVPVLLASFAGIDPPFAAAERTKSRFIAITESRQLSEVERNLLRRAYEHVLG